MKRVVLLIDILILSILFSCGSGAPKRGYKENINNLDKKLLITIESFPSGAKIFGINRNGSQGSYIGTTPKVFRYFTTGIGLNYVVGGDYVKQTTDVEVKDYVVINKRSFAFAFKCLIVKEGYEPYKLYEVLIEKNEYSAHSELKLEGNKTFKAFLTKSNNEPRIKE